MAEGTASKWRTSAACQSADRSFTYQG
jgi:hypothetical protein